MYLILIWLLSMTAFSQDNQSARDLFERYLESVQQKKIDQLLSLMNQNFLKKSGGESHWRDVIKTQSDKYQAAKVAKVDFKKIKDKFYARFTIDYPTRPKLDFTDDWYELQFVARRFVIHDFHSDFNPGVSEEGPN